MDIETLAIEIHEKTGYTGKELESAVHLTAMLYADLVGRKDIGDYFQNRLRQSNG